MILEASTPALTLTPISPFGSRQKEMELANGNYSGDSLDTPVTLTEEDMEIVYQNGGVGVDSLIGESIDGPTQGDWTAPVRFYDFESHALSSTKRGQKNFKKQLVLEINTSTPNYACVSATEIPDFDPIYKSYVILKYLPQFKRYLRQETSEKSLSLPIDLLPQLEYMDKVALKELGIVTVEGFANAKVETLKKHGISDVEEKIAVAQNLLEVMVRRVDKTKSGKTIKKAITEG